MAAKLSQVTEYWLCNTYQAVELMYAWNQTISKPTWLRYILTSSQRRHNLRFKHNNPDPACIELLPGHFWVSLLLNIVFNQNFRVYLPHKSRHLFESRLSAILFVFLARSCPPSKINYYDEGLSLLHVIAESKDYPSKALLTSRPMLCSESQYMFYSSLKDITQCCLLKVKSVHSTSKNDLRITVPHQKEGSSQPPKLHLIASRFLDYRQAFALSAKLVSSTLEMTFYSHPNLNKNPRDVPSYMKKKPINCAIEDYLVHTVGLGDIVILGFTSLLPYLLWKSANLCLDINIVILLHKPESTISDVNTTLWDSFLSCATSINYPYSLVQTYNERCSAVIFGPLAPKLTKILAALDDG